jgi:hypothetical protein
MDFFTSTRLLEFLALKRKEHYVDTAGALPQQADKPAEILHTPAGSVQQSIQSFHIFSMGGLVSFAIGIILGIAAVYLSWTCNTALQYNFGLKVFFAIFAYIFGLLYLILYILMRYDTCAYIKKTNYF